MQYLYRLDNIGIQHNMSIAIYQAATGWARTTVDSFNLSNDWPIIHMLWGDNTVDIVMLVWWLLIMSKFPGDLDDHDNMQGGNLMHKKFFCKQRKGSAPGCPWHTFVVGLGELGPFESPAASLVPRFGVVPLQNTASLY